MVHHFSVCPHCRATLKMWAQWRQSLQQVNFSVNWTAIAATMEQLRAVGAYRVPRWRVWWERVDNWLMRPVVAFRAAMTVALLLALVLANGTPLVARAAQQISTKLGQPIEWSIVLPSVLPLLKGGN